MKYAMNFHRNIYNALEWKAMNFLTEIYGRNSKVSDWWEAIKARLSSHFSTIGSHVMNIFTYIYKIFNRVLQMMKTKRKLYFAYIFCTLTISCLISFVDAVRKLFTAEKIFPSNVTVFQLKQDTNEK